jgi:hypothetical protein
MFTSKAYLKQQGELLNKLADTYADKVNNNAKFWFDNFLFPVKT